MNQTLIQDVVVEVMRRLGQTSSPAGNGAAASSAPAGTRPEPHAPAIRPDGRYGLFATIDECVAAATEAQKKLLRLSLNERDDIVQMFKRIALENAQEWGKLELDETKVGRLDHKIEKLQILKNIPGVEYLRTAAYSGTKGLALDEYAPFGVIGAITPVTHSIPTLTANAINMVAAGNTVVFNAHPSGCNCAAVAIREYNRQINARYGIENLLTTVLPPTLQTAADLFAHRGVAMLVVTGGPAVARAALEAKKRAVIAGPGNPPVVVDETACLANAAKSIITGAAYDNNLLCIGEKEVFVVESVFDKLMEQMEKHGAFRLTNHQVVELTRKAFVHSDKDNKLHVNKEFVGKDAAVLAAAIGVSIPPTTQLLIGETTADHVFVQEEQMMPFVPIVKCRNVDEAIERALQAEHGFRHTAIIHTRNMDTATRFGRLAATTIFVVNGPSTTGLGGGVGEGFGSYSIATPTGEGITNPLTFTRFRRIAIGAGAMRMI